MWNQIDYYQDQIDTLIEDRITTYDSPWLNLFRPGFREYDPELDLFPLISDVRIESDSFNHMDPGVSSIFGVLVGFVGGEGLPLRPWVMGAVTVANLVEFNSRDFVAGMLNEHLPTMIEQECLPRIDERFMADYSDVVATVLLNDEVSTWQSLLAFNAGAWWLMGFFKDIDARRKASPGRVSYHAQVRQLILNYARLGTFYVAG